MINVYIKIDSNNNIISINSDIFIGDKTDYLKIDSGEGDKFSHASSMYLEKGLIDSTGSYNYKLVDGVIVEKDSSEKIFNESTITITLPEQNRADIHYLALMTGVEL